MLVKLTKTRLFLHVTGLIRDSVKGFIICENFRVKPLTLFKREKPVQVVQAPDEAASKILFTRSMTSIYVWDVQTVDALEGFLIWRDSSRQQYP